MYLTFLYTIGTKTIVKKTVWNTSFTNNSLNETIEMIAATTSDVASFAASTLPTSLNLTRRDDRNASGVRPDR